MAGKSNIEWTEQTWNPIVGCSIVSPGCTNCYAMKMAARIEAMGNQPRYAGTTKKVKGNAVWTGKLAQAPDSVLLAPLRRKKPTTYFVNSMGDLFHEDCPDEWIDRVFAVMALSPQHTFQVLTKRAARMQAIVARIGKSIEPLERHARAFGYTLKFEGAGLVPWPLPNVWLGVSTERQQEADERIPHLIATPAEIRFISAEPLLGPVDFTEWLRDGHPTQEQVNGPLGMHYLRHGAPRLDWVIVGGESGGGYRPMDAKWAYSLRDQCVMAGVPVFIKQMAGKKPIPDDLMIRQFPRVIA